MEINGIVYTPSFGTKISKNILPLIARAKGTCPLHKKPLLHDAIKTIETLFPDRTIMRNNNEIHFQTIGFWTNHIVLTKVTNNALEDIRAIAANLEWLKIGVRKYSLLTPEQKIAVENFRQKWETFMEKRDSHWLCNINKLLQQPVKTSQKTDNRSNVFYFRKFY